jgi:ribosomal protein L7/L12
MSAKTDEILESLKSLSLLEASELVKQIEEAFGVSAAASAGVVMAAPGAAGGGEAAEEKTEFDVVLESFEASAKIKVLKAVREATWLGLGRCQGSGRGLLPRWSKKACPRTMPRPSRSPSKKWVARSRSSDPVGSVLRPIHAFSFFLKSDPHWRVAFLWPIGEAIKKPCQRQSFLWNMFRSLSLFRP